LLLRNSYPNRPMAFWERRLEAMSRKQGYMFYAGAALAVCLVLLFRVFTRSVKADADESSLRPVAVALVRRGPMADSVTLSGAFRAFEEVDVHAKVAGYIKDIYVDVGDKVRAGQVLAILEVPELSAEVAGARASIQRSQDAIRRSQSEIQRSESTHSAYHAAYARLKQAAAERPGLIAEQELDDASAKDQETEAQVASTRAALAESESQLAEAHANLDRLSALESYSHITAPFAGVVTRRYADTGALIQAGTASDTQSLPVVRLAEWSKLRLVVPVPESAVPEIHLGSVVNVRVPALGRTFEGKVARFADALDQQTRTMQTEIDVENPDGALVDGMYAETNLILKQKDGALTVPVLAVNRNGASASVLLVNPEGRLEERRVTLGEEGTENVEVVSGLAEGDRVVIGSRSEFKAGDKVQPRPIREKTVGAEDSI